MRMHSIEDSAIGAAGDAAAAAAAVATEPPPPPPLVPWSLSLPADAALDAAVDRDVILELRSGKMKPLPGLRVLSGIDKGLVTGAVQVTAMGLPDDEHDYTFHGGVEKAVHAYCSAHYAAWQAEFPEAADRFRPGGFGENLVFARMNERNVHIGDVLRVGPADGEDGEDDGRLLLQVCLSRQPCFKLSHRFSVRHFPPRTWQTSRTGWYYRVLRPGPVQAGYVARLVARPHPAWPVARLQEYMHRQPEADRALVAEAAALDGLGAEGRNMLLARLARQAREAQRQEAAAAEAAAAAAAGITAGPDDGYRPYRVVEKRKETARITAFVLEAVEADAAAAAAAAVNPGATVKVKLGGDGENGGGESALVRTYSVVSGRDANRFEIGVAYDAAAKTTTATATTATKLHSGSSSRFLHECVAVGDTILAGHMEPGMREPSASHHVFVAGGVGITAFLGRLADLRRIHYSCALHYAVRSAADVPFRRRLAALNEPTDGEVARNAGDDDPVVRVYDASAGQRLDVDALVRGLPWNSHMSVCGPPRLLQAVQRAARTAGLATGDVDYESFVAEGGGDPFAVDVLRQGGGEKPTTTTTLQVGADETLLAVLRRAFGQAAVDSSCEVGNCGSCRVTVRSGQVEHRGVGLADEDKADTLLACVSRGVGRIAVEI